MSVSSFRSATATALTCWLGFLACVVGCARPMLAAAICSTRQRAALSASSPEPTDEVSGCCHHQRHSSNRSGDKSQNTISCCPLDATLTQKQDLASPLHSDIHLAVLALKAFDSAGDVYLFGDRAFPTIWRSSRDVLLQTRILRI